jgi:hypothetical protein
VPDPPTNGRRLRFGLRPLFFVVTLLAICLGYLAQRANWRVETARRHNLLMAKLADNLLQPPNGVTYDSQQISRKYLERYFSQTWEERPSFFDLGNPARVNTQASTNFGFTIAKLPTGSHPADLCQRILTHYEAGMESVGVSRSMGSFSRQRGQSVWTDEGVVVIVDVWLNAAQTKGSVQMLVIDDQEFHIW